MSSTASLLRTVKYLTCLSRCVPFQEKDSSSFQPEHPTHCVQCCRLIAWESLGWGVMVKDGRELDAF